MSQVKYDMHRLQKDIVLMPNKCLSNLQARSRGGGGVGGVVRPPSPLQAEGRHFGHPLSQTFDQLEIL